VRISLYSALLNGRSVDAYRRTLYRKSAPGSPRAPLPPSASTLPATMRRHSSSVCTYLAPTRAAPSAAPLPEDAREAPGREKVAAAAASEASSEARRVDVAAAAPASLAGDDDEDDDAGAGARARTARDRRAGGAGARPARRRCWASNCVWFVTVWWLEQARVGRKARASE